jgi:hypothetical protein
MPTPALIWRFSSNACAFIFRNCEKQILCGQTSELGPDGNAVGMNFSGAPEILALLCPGTGTLPKILPNQICVPGVTPYEPIGGADCRNMEMKQPEPPARA